MIVCSCTVITDLHIEAALLEILNRPEAPIPTPGVIFRHLSKRMKCCGCAPLVVTRIYEIMLALERDGRICPYRTRTAKVGLERLRVQSPRLFLSDPAASEARSTLHSERITSA